MGGATDGWISGVPAPPWLIPAYHSKFLIRGQPWNIWLDMLTDMPATLQRLIARANCISLPCGATQPGSPLVHVWLTD
jgi:hypothetical protein